VETEAEIPLNLCAKYFHQIEREKMAFLEALEGSLGRRTANEKTQAQLSLSSPTRTLTVVAKIESINSCTWKR
jgi:hypothetical protein